MLKYHTYLGFFFQLKIIVFFFILLFGTQISIIAQSGKLDAAFGSNAGKVTTTFTSDSEDGAADVAIQTDGKIVAVGQRPRNYDSDVAIVRYKANGVLDSDFKGTGIVVFPVGSGASSASSVAIQPDGKIVAAGFYVSVGTTNSDFMLIRLNPDGEIDTSFGNDGVVLTDINNNASDYVNDIIIQPDGKIVAVGYSGPLTSWTEMAFARYNSDGTLDTGFGNNGKIVTQFGSGDDYAIGVALQTDGKIVVVGNRYGTNRYPLAILRFNTDGTADTTFDNDGVLTFDTITPDLLFGISLILQPDNSIVTAFTYQNANFNQDFALVKFNSDGTINTNFGNNGIVITPVGSFSDNVGDAILQPDGKIMVGGRSWFGVTSSNFSFVRYNPDGSIDNSFGTNGKVFTKINGIDDVVTEMTFQSDNKFIALGVSLSNTSRRNLALARYELNGELDKEFGFVGLVTESRLGGSDEARAVAIQPDGKIIAGGIAYNGSTSDIVLMRFNKDGSIDSSFGSFGRVNTFVSNEDDVINAIAIQTDGKIVATGFSGNSPDADLLVIRYNSNGLLDSTFSDDGKVILPLSNSADVGEDVLIQPDGKIVVAGYSPLSSISNFTVLRFNQNGTLDSDFNEDGIATTSINGSGGLARSVLIQSDGKIILAGNSLNSNQQDFAVARFNSNGSLDTSFGSNGIVVTQVGSGNDEANDSVLLPNGKIVVAGFSAVETGHNFSVVRYNQNGSLDQTFGENGKVLTSAGVGSVDKAYSVVSQPDGKIIVSGDSVTSDTSNSNFALVRYNEDGSLDSNFGSNGKVITDYGNLGETSPSMILQRDGKIVLAGGINKGEKREFALVRYQNQIPIKSLFDFDGDSKSDISVYRPSTGSWYLLQSSNNSFFGLGFGVSSDVIAPADFDGDGKTDFAVFRPNTGTWYLQQSTSGFTAVQFGQNGDIPVPADFDGDGKDDISVYRPSTGGWYRLNSSSGQFVSVSFGTSEDKPTIGDFDGDGKADIAVFRPSTGSWYRLNSSNNQFVAVQFGVAEDKPTPADFDGDGKTDIAVYRPSIGGWYRLNSSNGQFVATSFGVSEDRPAPADYDGDGKTDIAVFRPSDGNWYLLRSTSGFAAVRFGIGEDKPVPNAFVL